MRHDGDAEHRDCIARDPADGTWSPAYLPHDDRHVFLFNLEIDPDDGLIAGQHDVERRRRADAMPWPACRVEPYGVAPGAWL